MEVGKYKTRRTLCEGVILPLGTLSLLVAVAFFMFNFGDSVITGDNSVILVKNSVIIV